MAVSTGVVLVIVQALLRHRGRVDEILSQSNITEGLPFRLPPAAKRKRPLIEPMIRFFQTDNGQAVLELQDLTQHFKRVLQDHEAGNYNQNSLNLCFDLYFEAAEDSPKELANGSEEELRRFASTGPSEGLRIAYYVVESERLSRNNTTARIALATADTLLETLSGKASLFINDEVTAKIVDTAIQEFADKHDFDDQGAELIFRRLLGAVAVAAARGGENLSDSVGVQAFFVAVGNAHSTLGANDVAELISSEGLQATLGSFLTTVADDPSFLTSNETLQSSITTIFVKAANDLPDILGGKQDVVLSLVEALVSEAARNATSVLSTGASGLTLAETVFVAMLDSVQTNASQNALFKKVTSGKILGDLYKSALSTVAANSQLVQHQTNVDQHLATLISGYAGALAEFDPTTFGDDVAANAFVNRMMSMTLASLATHPGLTGHGNKFGPIMVSAMLGAAADLVRDGVQDDDLYRFIDEIVAASAENVALLNAGDQFNSVVGIWARVLSGSGVKALTSPKTRLQILRTGLMSMIQNPLIWKQLDLDSKTEGLITDILEALVSNQDQAVLSGLILERVVERVLKVISDNIDEVVALQDGKLREALEQAVSAINEGSTLKCSLDDAAGCTADFLKAVLDDPSILENEQMMMTELNKALQQQSNRVS